MKKKGNTRAHENIFTNQERPIYLTVGNTLLREIVIYTNANYA